MATEKQIEANRLNAQKSTGPRTDAGKSRSSTNSLKHGLRAGVMEVLPHEDFVEYNQSIDKWFEDFQPRNQAEIQLVRYAASLCWKIKRAEMYETYHLAKQVTEVADPLVFGPEHEFLEAAFLSSVDTSNEGERVRRYLFTLNRELRRTLELLAKLRKHEAKRPLADEKIAPSFSPNEPNSSAPNEPKSPSSPAPNEPNLVEQILASEPQVAQKSVVAPIVTKATVPNEPKSAPVVAAKVAKRAISLEGDFNPAGVKCTPWHQISCLKP